MRGPIWHGEIGDIPADANPCDEEIAVQYVAQAMAHEKRWKEALDAFTSGAKTDEASAALRLAHDRHFMVACTAFAAAALVKGWTPSEVRESLEMGDAWEHLYEWMWSAMGFRENEEMDDFLARLTTERASS